MKKYFFHCITIGLIFISLAACARQKKAGPLLQGRALEKDGKYLAALHHYEGMKDEDFRRDNIQNLYYLYGDIIESMQAIDGGNASAEQYYQLGEAYYEKIQSIPETAQIEPNRELDLNNYFEQQREDMQQEALTALNTATSMQPSHQEALWLEGQLHEERGETDMAILAYQKMLESDAGSVGILSRSDSGVSSAMPEASAVGKQNAKALARLGRLLYERGDREQGMEFTKHAVFHDPHNAESFFILAELYSKQGNTEQATKEFEKAICVDPQYIDAYHTLGHVYLREGNVVDAERVLLAGRVDNPDSTRLSVFHQGLKTVLDDKEQQTYSAIFADLVGEYFDRKHLFTTQGKNFEASPSLEIEYLKFIRGIVNRRRPYFFPCEGIQENPFFDDQVRRIDDRIEELRQLLIDEETLVSEVESE